MNHTKHERFESILYATSSLIRHLHSIGSTMPPIPRLWVLGWLITVHADDEVRDRYQQPNKTYDLPIGDDKEIIWIASRYDAWCESVIEEDEFDEIHDEYWQSLQDYYALIAESQN